MAITRKDIELIAHNVKFAKPIEVKPATPASTIEYIGMLTSWEDTIKAVAASLKHINPRFDCNRFYRACDAEHLTT